MELGTLPRLGQKTALLLALALILSLAIFSDQALGEEDHLHLHHGPGYSRERVTNEALSEAIENTAHQYARMGAIAARGGFYDLAFPRDHQEFLEMEGYGLLAVTAIVQDSSEIPLSRIYVRTREGDSVLQPIFTVSSRVSLEDSVVVKTFGRYRTDEMYLFPVHLRFARGVLLIDFAAHRKEFLLEEFPGEIPPPLQALPRQRPRALPPLETVRRMVLREYSDWGPFLPEISSSDSKK